MRTYTLETSRMPLREDFVVAGTTCVLSTNHHGVIDSLAVWKGPQVGSPRRSFELNVAVDSAIARSPERTMHFRGLHHLVFATFGDRELFLFDLQRLCISGLVSEETARDAHFWSHILIPTALGLMGTIMGVVPVHSACLDWNGRGLMVAGESGAGKSTLAVALAKKGFSVVSDDWTFVALDRDAIQSYGVYAPVKLLSDAAHFFPELSGLNPARTLNGELAFEVNSQRIFGSRVRACTNPKWIVFLERTEQSGCELTVLENERLRTFFETSVEPLPAQLSSNEKTRAKIIARLTKRQCWMLRYGGPPQVAAEALLDLCERSSNEPEWDTTASHAGA